MKYLIGAAIMLSALVMASCEEDNIRNKDTLKRLYKTYKNGTISECTYEGQLVYSAGYNAYDAGGAIYNEGGSVIESCNFGWGTVDSICTELHHCEVIYRVADNIWGQPAVNKYGF